MTKILDQDKLARWCYRLCKRIREAKYFTGRHERAVLLSAVLRRLLEQSPLSADHDFYGAHHG